MPRFVSLPWVALLVALAWPAGPARAQSGPIQNFRLLDEAGQPLAADQEEPGVDYYIRPAGVTEFQFAFDFVGEQAEEIKLRVLGPQGTALCPEQTLTLDTPGPQTSTCTDQGRPIPDGEYVINLYVGKQTYLADSMQVFVGEARPLPGVLTQTPPAETAGAPVTGSTPVPPEGPGPGPLAPNLWLLVMAGLGFVALSAIVVWAARSATRRA